MEYSERPATAVAITHHFKTILIFFNIILGPSQNKPTNKISEYAFEGLLFLHDHSYQIISIQYLKQLSYLKYKKCNIK